VVFPRGNEPGSRSSESNGSTSPTATNDLDDVRSTTPAPCAPPAYSANVASDPKSSGASPKPSTRTGRRRARSSTPVGSGSDVGGSAPTGVSACSLSHSTSPRGAGNATTTRSTPLAPCPMKIAATGSPPSVRRSPDESSASSSFVRRMTSPSP
jgi:hypothetical protein